MTVACALIPRFELSSALGARRQLLSRPVALAPEPGAAALVGEVSGPAEAHGVRAGMRLGEALARCPELVLVPADPVAAERAWEEVTMRLEGIGAAVFSERAGEAFFEADGLRGLWGGDVAGVLSRARRAIEMPVRLGAGPSPFCAYAAAAGARPGRPVVVPRRGRAFLAPRQIALLQSQVGIELPERLEQLGIRTLGDLAALSADAVADRFGEPGLLALRLARGEGEKLRPRLPSVPLAAEIELPEVLHGSHLPRAVELLIDRLLADPGRRSRTVRRLRLSARLAGGGGWRCERVLRRASSAQRTLRLVLDGAIEELPGPAELLRLEATALGPPAGDQLTLTRTDEERRNRLGEAVRQVRAAAGGEALLRVLDVDPGSRLPERRAVLTPFVT